MDELTEYLANSPEDGVWEQIQSEARQEAEREPMLVSFLFATVLRHTNWIITGAGGAAQFLGLNPSTLGNRIKKLGISRPAV